MNLYLYRICTGSVKRNSLRLFLIGGTDLEFGVRCVEYGTSAVFRNVNPVFLHPVTFCCDFVSGNRIVYVARPLVVS